MIYVVRMGDSLEGIALRFRTTVPKLLDANVICDPSVIFVDQPILVPDAGFEYQRAGGYPYYVVQFGDTLSCLASQFHQTETGLAAANQLQPGSPPVMDSELIVGFTRPDPVKLADSWRKTATEAKCDFNSMQMHGIYYIGSYQWETIGESGLPYLIPLLKDSCELVRYYAVLSLGRIATGQGVQSALQGALQDSDASVAQLAEFALARAQLVPSLTKRLHITSADQQLYKEPSGTSASVPVPKGSEVISLRWNIPSSTNEEGPRGGLEYYDQVQVQSTGQIGYLGRIGFNDSQLI
ncbi:LysM peptidoglycan-binding domain-containing protein [Paenibacillus sp. OV219]|uniref:LysM peptidoglycan-binding domain-containing protein n=1 Tax=Paenibacillus sp. OV219 TaxID=1884377 RepID=UPI0008CC6A01|nr:LysM peptidoglycan-binding domain-containing protein [Paenibacillus sp. OV219]SEO94913.1 LysM domain-containing protein [Paenibacillus sp. OV219]